MNFKSLEYVEELEEAGVPRGQAKIHAKTIQAVIDDDLATKQDLLSLEQRITIKFGSMMAIGIGIIAALIKF